MALLRNLSEDNTLENTAKQEITLEELTPGMPELSLT